MPSTPFKIEAGKFGISLTDPAITDACTATVAAFDDFSCAITDGALNATSNVTDDTTPATWCDAEQTTPKVGATTFEGALSFLQDPQIVAGLSRTLFEHDTETAWIFMGLDGDDPPKAVAKVRLVAGAFGGEARTSLLADVTLPCDGKPLICYGDTAGSISIPIPAPIAATGATAGTPGTFQPVGATVPANLAAMATLTATPVTAWTIGQRVVLGDASEAYWNGTAYVVGRAP